MKTQLSCLLLIVCVKRTQTKSICFVKVCGMCSAYHLSINERSSSQGKQDREKSQSERRPPTVPGPAGTLCSLSGNYCHLLPPLLSLQSAWQIPALVCSVHTYLIVLQKRFTLGSANRRLSNFLICSE